MGQAPGAPLVIDVESEGGDPRSALFLFDNLRAHAAPVTCTTTFSCHSAALICFLGGDIRLASPTANFLLHQVERQPSSGWTRATSVAYRAEAANLEEFDKEIVSLICSRSRYPAWQLRRDMVDET